MWFLHGPQATAVRVRTGAGRNPDAINRATPIVGGAFMSFISFDYSRNHSATIADATGQTQITTRSGRVGIQNLRIGQLIRTADGRDVPVTWIGRQTIVTRFGGDRVGMVRIRAGALNNHTDLLVTSDHGLIVDGFVVNASALVNRRTITFEPLADLGERFTVYHIETPSHDVIMANGTRAETYLNMPGRRAFDNYEEYLDLYGSEPRIIPSPMSRIGTARLLPTDLCIRTRACLD